MKKVPIPDCLQYAGFLGHTWFVTNRDPSTGNERLLLQANDAQSACRTFDETNTAVAIYQAVGRNKFKRVSRRAASIA